MVIDRRVALILRGFDFYFTAFEAFHTRDGNMSKAFIGYTVISLRKKKHIPFRYISDIYYRIPTHWRGCVLIKNMVLISVKCFNFNNLILLACSFN